MKYLLIILVLALTSLLTACSGNKTTDGQAAISNASAYQDIEADTSVLEELVNVMNNHDIQTALDLFKDSAIINEVSLVDFIPDTQKLNWAYTQSGKDEIKDWLKYQTQAIIQIVPVKYEMAGTTVTLKAGFYYTNQTRTMVLEAQTKGGRLTNLNLYIENTSLN